MSKKSLADLREDRRTSPSPVRSERSFTVCLRPDLVARIQAKSAELETLPQPERSTARKMGEGADATEHPRAAELRAEIRELLEEAAADEGELTVRANMTDGEWRQFADANPAREKDEPGYDRDKRVVNGLVNVDALLEQLGAFAHAWDDEPLGEGDWAAIFDPAMAQGDKYEAVRLVVSMYESRLDFRTWRSGLFDALQRFDDSASPETSESPRSDSTAGSPDESSGAST